MLVIKSANLELIMLVIKECSFGVDYSCDKQVFSLELIMLVIEELIMLVTKKVQFWK